MASYINLGNYTWEVLIRCGLKNSKCVVSSQRVTGSVPFLMELQSQESNPKLVQCVRRCEISFILQQKDSVVLEKISFKEMRTAYLFVLINYRTDMLAGIKICSAPWSLHACISFPYLFRKPRSRWSVRGSSPSARGVSGLKLPLPRTRWCLLWLHWTTAASARRPSLAQSKMQTVRKRRVGTRSRWQLGAVRWRSCQTDAHTPPCILHGPLTPWCVPVRSAVEVCTPRKRKPHRCWPSFWVRGLCCLYRL